MKLINHSVINVMEERIWIAVSRLLEATLFVMGVWSIWKQDWLWVFACFFGFILSISPIIVKRNIKFSVHWLIEFLLVFAISLHVWGGVLDLYSIPFYDKIAHFLASVIVAFFALIAVYVMDVFSPRIHMDVFMLGFFIAIFTVAMGTIWEIAEFVYDQFVYNGESAAQVSLRNTMGDLIADSVAGIIMGIVGAIAIRKGEFKEILTQMSKEAGKINTRYLNARDKAISSLKDAIESKEVDERIIPIVEKINAINDFFTTSSCSGRIVLLELPSFGKKRKAKFLGKWHGKVNIEEIKKVLKEKKEKELWFLVQSPIFHIATISMKNAKKLLNIAIQSGFKYSSIKAVNGKIVVEILTAERLDAPLVIKDEMFVGDEYIKTLIDIANKMIGKMNIKLKRLEKNLESLN